ncbi:MAG TPA: hypothetical protein VLM79_08170 [Kofleriaceae bacterium]|nr:hypothetical protein [Kofleriaceae bacterium]
MTELPPRQRLVQLVRSLGRHLPQQLAPLVAHPRFAEHAAALARLSDDAHLTAAVSALAETEAAWLADLLLERWHLLAVPVLEPIAAIVAPVELWLGREPVRVPLAVAVVGAEPGWEVMWDGATATSGTPGAAVAIADPAADLIACRAHVRARTATGRVALTAAARIVLRRPAVTVRDDRRRIVVADQHGAPAVGVTLAIGDSEHTTGPGGLVELAQPAAPGAPLRVQSIPAGRIPDKT